MGEINKPTGNLKKLILICLENIKGMTRAEEIESLLPIDIDNIRVEKNNNAIEIFLNNQLDKTIWKEKDCYMNLEILKSLTKEYEISCKSDDILELMKYKNKVTLMLL